MHRTMSYPQEKGFLVVGHIAAAAASWVGAILSTGDVRWLMITCFSSVLMSCLLAVTFKSEKDTIQYVAARCGFAVFGGVFMTKYVAWQFSIEIVHDDPIALAGIASLITIITFTVGFKAIRYLEKRSDFLGRKLVDSKAKFLTGDES